MEKILEALEGPNGPWIALAALAAAALLGGALFLKIGSFFARVRIAGRARRGRRMEGQARRLLEESGFTVLGEQVPQQVTVFVDGEKSTTTLHADFLVKRKGRLLVADSKTGAEAACPPSARVRRQLMEYCLVYGCSRALLVDMENLRIREMAFDYSLPMNKGIRPAGALILCLLSLLAGFVAAALLPFPA